MEGRFGPQFGSFTKQDNAVKQETGSNSPIWDAFIYWLRCNQPLSNGKKIFKKVLKQTLQSSFRLERFQQTDYVKKIDRVKFTNFVKAIWDAYLSISNTEYRFQYAP